MVDQETLLGVGANPRPVAPSKAGPGGRQRILDVARAAFIERGYADVSMQEIADAAGLTKAAIYYHFKDKEELFQQVLVEEVDRLCAGVAAELAAGPPLRGQIERVARFAFETSRGDFGRLLSDAHRYCAQDRLHAIRDHIQSPYALIREAFQQARAAGEIRDVDIDVTMVLYLSMVGSQMKGAEFGPAIEKTPEELAVMVADMVMRGIGTETR
jgi:AcrR family transcriptional regulator